MTRNKRGTGRRFLQLYSNVKRSRAYHGLSARARASLFELIDRYTGINNGMIGLGIRELCYELHCGTATAMRALDELEDAGLVERNRVGQWKGRKATEWRLTFLRCDVTRDLPKQSWNQRTPYKAFQSENAEVPQQEHRCADGPASKTQTRNSSNKCSEERSTPTTHIDIYQEGDEPDRRTIATPPGGNFNGPVPS